MLRRWPLPLRGIAGVCALLIVLCSLPFIGVPSFRLPIAASDTPNMTETELVFDGAPLMSGMRIAIILKSPQGQAIPIVADARVTAVKKILVPIIDVLYIKEAERLGTLGYKEIPPIGPSPLKAVKDIVLLTKMVAGQMPAPSVEINAGGTEAPAEEGLAERSRIWILGDPQMYVIDREGNVQVTDGGGN